MIVCWEMYVEQFTWVNFTHWQASGFAQKHAEAAAAATDGDRQSDPPGIPTQLGGRYARN